MANHRIEVNDNEMLEWRADYWRTYASSTGAGQHKRLRVSGIGEYRVTSGGALIYQGDDLQSAVKSYNEAL